MLITSKQYIRYSLPTTSCFETYRRMFTSSFLQYVQNHKPFE